MIINECNELKTTEEAKMYLEMGKCLNSTYFYDISRKTDKTNVDLLEVIARFGLEPVTSLRFGLSGKEQENNTSFGHMILCTDSKGNKVKARNCFSSSEAERMERSVAFAANNSIQTPKILARDGQVIILEYIDGENPEGVLPLEDIRLIAEAHAEMEIPLPELESKTAEKLHKLISEALLKLREYLPEATVEPLEKALIEKFPTKIYPVFDHQDNGVHNILKGKDGQYWFIDEEAFGVLPFGYTLERALFGNGGHTICKNDSQREVYMSCFTPEQIDYYIKTREFWKMLLVARSSARALEYKEVDRALGLINEA